MLCEAVLGRIEEERFEGMDIDYVDISWDEAFKRIHKKISEKGTELGIRLGEAVLVTGLRTGQVLGIEENTAYVVRILAAEALVITVASDHPRMVAKVCYEIGNRHAPLFWGEGELEFVTPYTEPMKEMLHKLHGVTVRKESMVFDFDKRISASVHSHTH
ncbi:MAG: urease accessory protein UreE [Eubacteriales bacterium]|nr:urease accessory protein UreE [Eubacteriales bacterium]